MTVSEMQTVQLGSERQDRNGEGKLFPFYRALALDGLKLGSERTESKKEDKKPTNHLVMTISNPPPS